MTAIFTESEYEIELSSVQGPAGVSQSVNYIAQSLTSDQQTQARSNISAASATHAHGNITTDGKIGSTANLPLITGAAGAITVGSFGTTANTFCQGDDSRVANAVQSNVSYANPTWITEIAASKITGTLAKSQQHTQTAYKDEANTWAGAATFNGNITVNNAGIGRVGYGPDSYIEGTANDLNIRQGGPGSTYIDFGASTDFRRNSDFTTRFKLTEAGLATFYGASGTISIQPFGGATAIDGSNLYLRSGYQDLTFVTNSGTAHNVPLVLRNNDAIFGGNITASAATFNGMMRLGDYTVGTLPSAAANAGHEANVTDSSVTTFGSTVAGSGSSRVKVYSNGTNWTVQAA